MPTQRYKVNGKQVPSVTTVIGRFKESGALIYWANHLAIDVLEESLSLLHKTQNVLGHPQETHPSIRPQQEQIWNQNVDFFASDPIRRADAKQYVKEAATAGSICHDLVENWLLAITSLKSRKNYKSPSIQQISRQRKVSKDLAMKAHTAFSAFLKWVDETGFALVETEMPLTSKFYNFGGCPDCLTQSTVIIEQQPTSSDWIAKQIFHDLFDWKTSGRIYPDYMIQLAAYILLIEENAYCEECFLSPEDYQENRWYEPTEYQGTATYNLITREWIADKDFEINKESEYRGNPNCQNCYGLGTTKPIANAHCVRFDKEDGHFNHMQFTKEQLLPAQEMFLKLRECYETDKLLKKMVK
jgi:hypothetical protein